MNGNAGAATGRARKIVGAVAATVVVAAVAAGLWGLAAGPGRRPADAGGAAPRASAPADTSHPGGPAGSALAGESEVFARRAASLLFDWDTAEKSRGEVVDALIALADQSGEGEADGLAADVGNYVPDADMWGRLRANQTRQRLQIDTVAEPAAWDDAVAGARPGQIPQGAAAWTVAGVRHREGVWEGEPVSYEEPVAFTLFTACDEAGGCRLLRVSLPGQPLG
ncbi:MAG: hypothetical protein LBK95_13895 [Bifidobacteriaceae bacterium]|jgi:hypothetical protein|nr:hypothetical protein [Bifidobacteriaceae bacterium]